MDMMQKIRECFEFEAILYTRHARYEMENVETHCMRLFPVH